MHLGKTTNHWIIQMKKISAIDYSVPDPVKVSGIGH